MTTPFTAIHFFYNSVIISRQHLNEKVKRNQNITKGSYFGALCRNPQPGKDAYTRLSGLFQFQVFFGVFLSYFQTLRLSSSSSLPVVDFSKYCVILFKQESSDQSFIFLTVLASLRGVAGSIHSIIQGYFFYRSGCSDSFFQRLYRIDNV